MLSGCSDTQKGMGRKWIPDSMRTPPCPPFPAERRPVRYSQRLGTWKQSLLQLELNHCGMLLLIDLMQVLRESLVSKKVFSVQTRRLSYIRSTHAMEEEVIVVVGVGAAGIIVVEVVGVIAVVVVVVVRGRNSPPRG